MFAIIETGGKQYRVEEGLELNVDLIKADAGNALSIDSVLLVDKDGDTKIGAPYIEGAAVECEVLGHTRGEKIVVFHKLSKKDARKTQGHRQDYTQLKVKSIKA
ncbi:MULTISPECIES: 50S ribosomal protein L21 [unclassified Pseudodesulfovibrio]|uniref:50S ribosomal protein L21 n=1 Tax=unclassified Pseudodesulfovibrio TaxID=2661612 RepID=UPI000FEB6F16|nr:MULTISPECIES: 50S ribosomal protein L21 [unclassified Pseudodesulfovibrio]MCJ2163587.1 50S ribosomal protein L21 [Pseudodesulfovibrio sp. S3-i]RWU06821.1 50S ribosomal protein L21 [Pseudodesulfovibrio sp. S3]